MLRFPFSSSTSDVIIPDSFDNEVTCSCHKTIFEMDALYCLVCGDVCCSTCQIECFDCGKKVCINCAESHYRCLKCHHKIKAEKKAFVVLGNKEIPVKNSEYFINKIQSLGVHDPMVLDVGGKKYSMKIPVWHTRKGNNSILDYYVYMEECI